MRGLYALIPALAGLLLPVRVNSQESCEYGLHFDEESGSCQKNQCWCNGGSPQRTCTEDGAESCEPNSCVAQHKEVTANGVILCQRICPPHQHVNSNGMSCLDNVCSCNNGIKMTKCLVNGSQACNVCDDGYEKVYSRVSKSFHCRSGSEDYPDFEGGLEITGRSMDLSNSNSSKAYLGDTYDLGDYTLDHLETIKCEDGFHLSVDGKACLPNQCFCIGGQPLQNCKVHGTEQCDFCWNDWTEEPGDFGKVCRLYCKRGFHLQQDGRSCLTNQCSCTGGQRTQVCYEHEVESCEFCFMGFGEVMTEVYSNGVTEFIRLCDKDAWVLECSQFEHPSNDNMMCLQNSCSCMNGQQSNPCPVHQGESCERCQEPFFRMAFRNDTGLGYCELDCPSGWTLNPQGTWCDQVHEHHRQGRRAKIIEIEGEF